MRIYLDTNIWNLMCDSSVNPSSFLTRLARHDSQVVLGTHSIYELAKTFVSSRPSANERGIQLFSYLKNFVEADIDFAKQNNELLAAEMWALQLRMRHVNALLGPDDREKLRAEVGKLARGTCDDRARTFIQQQSAFASITRSRQARHLDIRADTKLTLKGISAENLDTWLKKEAVSLTGAALLASHIKAYFPEASTIEAGEYALAILGSPFCRFGSGVVRADLYYNWRCANRGSVSKDLVDDMYHVLAATYFDIYATGEAGQAKYARLLLTPATQLAVYDNQSPVDDWLINIASRISNSSPAKPNIREA